MICSAVSNSTRITSRFLLSVTLGTLVILLFNDLTAFDNTSALGLFSSVVVVASEDVSLGPVLWKGFLRSVGSVVGGFLGYLLLFLPTEVYSSVVGKRMFLVIIPTTLVTVIIWLSKGGYATLSDYVKENKIFHAIQFGIVSFGTVYIGSWDLESGDHALRVALLRTSSVFIGCLIVMLSSLIAFPITSMHLCSKELSTSLKSLGELAKNICADRNSGLVFHPSQPQFSQVEIKNDGAITHIEDKKPDTHIKLMNSIYTKITRVEALIPFFNMEPSWAVGYSISLFGKEKLLHSHFGTFIAMVTGRLYRIKSSLVAMDINTRIDSSDKTKKINEKVVKTVTEVGDCMCEDLAIVGDFIESPFIMGTGWQGDKSLKQRCLAAVDATKSKLLALTAAVNESIEKYNSLLLRDDKDEKISPTIIDFDSSHPATFRQRLGDEVMESWHKIYPMRAFCNMTFQVAMQTCGLVLEVVSYIDMHFPLSEEEEEGSESASPSNRLMVATPQLQGQEQGHDDRRDGEKMAQEEEEGRVGDVLSRKGSGDKHVVKDGRKVFINTTNDT